MLAYNIWNPQIIQEEILAILSVVLEWLTLLLRIREVPGSNISPETGYPYWFFRGCPQSLQANAGIVP
jgi:hypothetical protein